MHIHIYVFKYSVFLKVNHQKIQKIFLPTAHKYQISSLYEDCVEQNKDRKHKQPFDARKIQSSIPARSINEKWFLSQNIFHTDKSRGLADIAGDRTWHERLSHVAQSNTNLSMIGSNSLTSSTFIFLQIFTRHSIPSNFSSKPSSWRRAKPRSRNSSWL